jgi:hypothetical protein
LTGCFAEDQIEKEETFTVTVVFAKGVFVKGVFVCLFMWGPKETPIVRESMCSSWNETKTVCKNSVTKQCDKTV